jgi:hypothetical protein
MCGRRKERISIRALTKARCIRTLTFILSLTGRGDSQGRRREQNPSLRGFLFPFPVRERMKVRVLVQRAFLARESGFRSVTSSFRTTKKLVDRAKNLLHTLKHLAIPESKHSIAFRFEKRGADFIFSRSLEMLRPVELDDKPSLSRAEISEVRPDRMLTAKLRAAHLPIPQMHPQNPLRVGLLAPQSPRIPLR